MTTSATIHIYRKVKLTSLLYFIALSLYLLQGILQTTCLPISLPKNATYYLCALLLTVSILCRRKHNKEILLSMVFMACLTVIMYFYSELFYIVLLCLFVYHTAFVDADKSIKIFFVMHLTVMLLCIAGSAAGFVESRVWTHSNRIRYALGYQSYNYAPKVLFYLVLAYAYLRKTPLTLRELFAIEAINVALFLASNSRTELILITLYLPAVYVLQNFKRPLQEFFWAKKMYIGIIVLSLLSLVLGIAYAANPVRMAGLDQLLSSRLRLSAEGLKNFGISLFGQKIFWQGVAWNNSAANSTYNYIDSSYLQIIFNNGIVFFVFIVMGLVSILSYAVKTDNRVLFLNIVFVSGIAVLQPQLIDIRFDIFILLIGTAIQYKMDQKEYELDQQMYEMKIPQY